MHPPQAVWELMFPIVSHGPNAEAEAIKKGSAVQLQGSRTGPHDQWIKVSDTDTGKIVTGALWKFYNSNPYRVPFGEFDPTWFSEGEPRDLCNSMNTQLRAWRPETMAAPHALLKILFTHPEDRNRGVAGLLVEWGTRKADKRGLEAYVEEGQLVHLHLDLADLSTIKASAEAFLAKNTRLDIVFNNAGVLLPPQGSKTAQGRELQIGTNCLDLLHFTKLLRPMLAVTAKTAAKSSIRVVWVSSNSAKISSPQNGIDMTDIDYHIDKNAVTKCGTSKASDIFHSSESA
ncbi:hypothetical protein HO133_008954 [Letharia lupina]|uniref:Uncharacterized protein n=1 Tax=Letharia lupina TaxID=560253 RepID=A0A8H6CMR2_9LECA|nr:uncharacterized protein HO133_008954 [Letharia lupina]KAF6226089.1 hypothetical protein HO133_008954 [Letharia lupina]